MKHEELQELKIEARSLRRDVLELAIKFKNGHIAAAYSTIEIVVALYRKILKLPEDRFIMSKGHGCLSLYAMLRKIGYNPKPSGHPDIDVDEGITCTTGSLGHGLPIGLGIALAKKLKGEKGRVFVLLGDGECQEGTTWESLNLARRYELDNLAIIIDHNRIQALGSIEDIMGMENIAEKFTVFGCNTVEINGHNFDEIFSGLYDEFKTSKPRAIIAHTTKGKGLSFMESRPEWHNRLPKGDLLKQAYKELGEAV
ncbi:transketolase [Candidatus Peregrinibacteria bacterium]|nr:transketolase [Candidatus Peregrinibacteria bacterium]